MWSWDNRVGNCNEAQAVSYFILSRVGISARTIASNPGSGHDFVAIGVPEGFNPNDPSTWGPDAMVVDGWTGEALTPAEARESSYHGNGGRAAMSDRTSVIVKPDQDRFWAELAGKGILFVVVRDKKTTRGIDGATVRVTGTEVSLTETTSRCGKVTMTLPPGKVDIQIIPPSRDYEPASRTAEVGEHKRVDLSVTLEPVIREETAPSPVTASKLVGEGAAPYGMQASGPITGRYSGSSFSGSLSHGRVQCLMLLGENRFEFRFPVEGK